MGIQTTSIAAPLDIWIFVSGANLNPGTYTATIEVSSPVAVNSPRTITVTLTVPPPLLE